MSRSSQELAYSTRTKRNNQAI